MPTRTRVQQFINLVEQGRYVDAIDQFYADDSTTYENGQSPCTGRPALINKEEAFLGRIRSIKARPATTFLVDADRVVIHWVFDIVDGKNRALTLDELAYQLWRGDKIVEETYYYDPAQMRGPASES